MPLSPEEDAELRRQINREIDADLERCRFAAQQPSRARNDDKIAAVRALERQRQAEERKWVEQIIDAKLTVFAKAVGQVIAQYRAETLERVNKAIAAAAEARSPDPSPQNRPPN